MGRRQSEAEPTLFSHDERACAFHRTVVFQRQAYPNMALMTYDDELHRGAEQLLLVKFVAGVGLKAPRWLTYEACREETTANNVPGGLKSVAVTDDGVTVTSEIYPLLIGRDSQACEGAALIRVRCESNKNVWLKFGNGNIAFMHYSPNRDMAGDGIDCGEGDAEIEGGTVYVSRKGRSVVTAVKGSFRFESRRLNGLGPDKQGGRYVVACAEGQEGYLIAAFAKDAARASALAGLDPEAEFRRVERYYAEKLAYWYIRTPSPQLDEAFMHAFLNVEYSWFRPYGWIECIHHWPAMWHMEHTAAEEWAGNPDRTRDCLRSQMRNLFESGAVPDMCVTGEGRRDWGGNNQFFFREVDHYLRMTGDMDFAREAEPYMERILEQTFREYDPAGSDLIAWGTQIGNQEDFESTPGAGAATGSEGVRMLEIMADLKQYLGREGEAERLRSRAAAALEALKKTPWLKDLGRYAWYRDIRGETRLETTYHGIAYPVLYDQVDDCAKASSMDHLKHRLTGPEGEVYQSNHFGDHLVEGVPTWGMQCGSNMQAFAAAAYARLGMRNDAVLPLEFVARRVCGEFQRGSFPETANEKRFAYFSPSAAVFSQAVIESIFGVTLDRRSGLAVISPCFPDSWERAEMKVTGASLRYRKTGNRHRFDIHVGEGFRKVFQWRLPPYRSIAASCHGEALPVRTSAGCGWFEAEIDLPDRPDVELEIEYEPIALFVRHAARLACGEALEIEVAGAELLGVGDRCGVFDAVELAGGRARATVGGTLLDPYMKFGRLGLMNFARRPFTLRLRHEGMDFDYPCAVVVTPRFFCRGICVPGGVEVEIRNLTGKASRGVLWLRLCGLETTARGAIPAGGEARFMLRHGDELLAKLSPGKNAGRLLWRDDECPERGFACDIDVEAGERQSDIRPVPLDGSLLKPAEYWPEIGWHRSHGHMKQGPEHFMKGLFETGRVIKLLDSVPMALDPRGFLPLSMEKHRIVEIPLAGITAKKLYILMSAFIDNHDVYATAFRLEMEAVQGDAFIRPVYRRDLTFPGELDMGFGNAVIAGFATYVEGTARDGLPELPAGAGDYPEAMPPAYPQRGFWSGNRAAEVCNAVFNLIELDMGEFRELKTLRVIAAEAHAAGGIFALAAHVKEE